MSAVSNQSDLDLFTFISKISSVSDQFGNLPPTRHVEGDLLFYVIFGGPYMSHVFILRHVDVHRCSGERYKFLCTTSNQLTLFPLFPAVLDCFRTPGIFPEFPTSPNTETDETQVRIIDMKTTLGIDYIGRSCL